MIVLNKRLMACLVPSLAIRTDRDAVARDEGTLRVGVEAPEPDFKRGWKKSIIRIEKDDVRGRCPGEPGVASDAPPAVGLRHALDVAEAHRNINCIVG
jgi:hypothetical protein